MTSLGRTTWARPNNHFFLIFDAGKESMAGAEQPLFPHLQCWKPNGRGSESIASWQGWLQHCTFFPHLKDVDPCPALAFKLQTPVHDVARIICSSSRTDYLPVASLLEGSDLPSVNRLAVKSVAVEAWKSLGPPNGADPIPVASLFGLPVPLCTRAGGLGVRKPATKFPVKSFIDSATTLWNSNQDLRMAQSIGAMKRAAFLMAKACPL